MISGNKQATSVYCYMDYRIDRALLQFLCRIQFHYNYILDFATYDKYLSAL